MLFCYINIALFVTSPLLSESVDDGDADLVRVPSSGVFQGRLRRCLLEWMM